MFPYVLSGLLHAWRWRKKDFLFYFYYVFVSFKLKICLYEVMHHLLTFRFSNIQLSICPYMKNNSMVVRSCEDAVKYHLPFGFDFKSEVYCQEPLLQVFL